MNCYLDVLGVGFDEFEFFIMVSFYEEKMMEMVCNECVVNEYFKFNLFCFDSVEVSYILVEKEGMVKELFVYLWEDLDSFVEMVWEYLIVDIRE